MGHYCGECGEKLVGGIVANTCDCFECFCKRCWKNFFSDGYALSTKEYYYYDNSGKLIREHKTLYCEDLVDEDDVCCKECNTPYGGIRNCSAY